MIIDLHNHTIPLSRDSSLNPRDLIGKISELGIDGVCLTEHNAAWDAADMCMQTFGGFGFAEEYDIERKFRESRLYQIAPISTNMILGYIGQHVLGLPRSY